MIGIQDSNTNHFGSLIRSGDKFKIPRFQRDYSWEEQQWDDLWQDIEDMIANNGEHYMGYLVLQMSQEKYCTIIDGQQRFTTITMIILAAIKALQKLVNDGIEVEENEQRIKTLKDTYIGNIDPVTLEYDNILVLNRNNDGYYKDYIVKLGELKYRNTTYTEKLMRKCFEWYYKKLDNKFSTGREYAEFITYVAEHLYFTIIRVNNEMNAFRVFETLNARGVQLSSADLLKNYLFSLVDNKTYPERISILEEKWSALTKNIQAEKLPDFIRYYWNSKYKTVRSNNLFKEIRNNIKRDSDVFALVTEMNAYSDIYMALHDQNDELWHNYPQIKEYIKLLSVFNLKQPYSLLMASYMVQKDITAFERLLKDIIIISFRYNVICGKNPNDIEKTYNIAANSISSGRPYELDMLKDIYIADDEFVSAFAHKSFTDSTRNNHIIRYILGKIERFKGGTRDADLDGKIDTIEHILPQNPGKEWGDDNYTFDAYIYRLGNLCLLEKSLNRDIENKSYSEKSEAYIKSAFITTRSIPEDYKEWGIDNICKRQQRMADCAKTIWKIDFN